MKKIGIITIIDNNNYGNRLQNYALQELLKKMNNKVETIINWPSTNQKNTKIDELKKKIRRKLGNIKRKIKYVIHKKEGERHKNFKKFNQDYMIFSPKEITYHNAKTIEKKYDFFMVGSDQVWNPDFERLSEIDLLTFSNEQKNISYAASFAVSNISKEQEEKCRQAFAKFKGISVREEEGKKIIDTLDIGKEVEVLIDPTMMLTAEEWRKVSKKPKQLKSKRYILNYFLGNLSEKRKKEIERIAKDNDCDIINILNKKEDFYGTGPSEFLYLIQNAFLICTDSFHSCVFSILFNNPFIVFSREEDIVSINSRIETLLKKFELKDRMYDELAIKKEQLVHDYKHSYTILEKEREKSLRFLEKAIDKKE